MKLKITVHRGGADSPEYANQLKTFLTSGANAWEADLRLTKDGEVILMHDNTLRDRVAGYGLESQSSTEVLDQDVSTLTYDQIKKITSGHINTLNELLKIVPRDVDLLLDVKTKDPELAKKIKESFSHFETSNVIFICFFLESIKVLKSVGLKNRIALLTVASETLESEIRLKNLGDLDLIKQLIDQEKLDGIGIEYARNDNDVREIVQDLRKFNPLIQIQFWVHKENECKALFELAKELDIDYCNSDSPKAHISL